ncbi:MAG TPA: two pore domain potassium channel family protein [Allosphingosinicella sp.]|nr:two pore domain potassium channel family protein [Allosphingosinicella sp.]
MHLLRDDDTLQLITQLTASAGLALLMTVLHGVGLILIARMLRLRKERLEEKELDHEALLLVGTVGMLVFALHTLEICVFAGFYLMVGAIGSLEEALYYSAAAYATLGRTAEYFPSDWRLVGAFEALIGFLLIGWSTAFVVSTMNRLRR